MSALKFFGVLALGFCCGCASQTNKGGAGTEPFTQPGMSSKMEIGDQENIGPNPRESSPSTRNTPSAVPPPNAPDRGDDGNSPGPSPSTVK